MFGIDDSKDADSDERKWQTASQPQKQEKPKPTPDQVLKAFTEAAGQKTTQEELKQAFAKAWSMLEGTTQQATAKDVYDIRKSELEEVAA